MSSETVLGIQGNSEGLYADVCKIIASEQSEAYRAINVALPNNLDSASPKSVLLTWTHYRTHLCEENDEA